MSCEFNTMDMLNWTHDVPQGSRDLFLNNIKQKPAKKILEVGTYAGVSALTMFKEMLKISPEATLTVVDVWDLPFAAKSDELNQNDMTKVEAAFYENCSSLGFTVNQSDSKIRAFKSCSSDALIKLHRNGESFDLIYVDGCHLALNTYCDLVLAWAFLSPGGRLIVDDVYWKMSDNEILNPFVGIRHFFKEISDQIDSYEFNYRLFIVKK